MSTFDGIVHEFPDIRIDYFRHHPGKAPPAACFLSHVHSDHLQGLETLKMPFVYCSAVTKRILSRMEKYPHRINFAKGILEARKQTYKSLKLISRALPLETPVEIELGPKSRIRVTLFDANHCPGAVMFLIENSSHAILYTGDVRAEPWWVNSIARNPILLPYSGGIRALDCIYLDTTFATRDDIYEHFPTKAEGLKELLIKVSKCPQRSTFYFRSWTFGYEDVWIALSNYLQSRVHVDAYQLRIFKSLADDVNSTDRGPALAGFSFGNQHQAGCLTDDNTVRIHSCEPGTDCYDNIKGQKDVVWITPIITRLKNGTVIPEVGAGGGGRDLFQVAELEMIDEQSLDALKELSANNDRYKNSIVKLEEELSMARRSGKTSIALQGLDLDEDEEISLKQFVQLMSKQEKASHHETEPQQHKNIHFPYSRHASFSELRHLISSFRPKDICPCTVDLDTWSEDVSMKTLFGDLCSRGDFMHDQVIRSIVEIRQENRGRKRKRDTQPDTQTTSSQESGSLNDVYKSAQTSIENRGEALPECQVQSEPDKQTSKSRPKIPLRVRCLQRALAARFKANRIANNQETESSSGAEAEADTATDSQESTQQNSGNHNTAHKMDNKLPKDSVTPLPTSVFEPQSQHHDQHHTPSKSVTNTTASKRHCSNQIAENKIMPRSNKPSDDEGQPDEDTDESQLNDEDSNETHRLASRKDAYRAAKSVLYDNDHVGWTGLRLRSLGWKGHTDEEIEL